MKKISVAFLATVAMVFTVAPAADAWGGHHQPRAGAWFSGGEVSVGAERLRSFNVETWGQASVSESYSSKHGSHYSSRKAKAEVYQSVHASGKNLSVYSSGVSASAYLY